MYTNIEQFNEFENLLDFPRKQIGESAIDKVRDFHEINDIERILEKLILEPNKTPHGPTEIADIITHQISLGDERGSAAFILKGRSFRRITAKDVAHQIFRLRYVADLKFALLGFVGDIQDDAKDVFVRTALDLGIRYSIIDRIDMARLAVAAGFICLKDGGELLEGRCECGYLYEGNGLNVLQDEALSGLRHSHKMDRTSAIVVLPPGSGKTRVAVRDTAQNHAKKILYIAHTHEILDVAEKEFSHLYGSGFVYKGPRLPAEKERFVQITTIQSLRGKLESIPKDTFDYLVIDEFHHAAAPTYQDVIRKFEPAFLLGLTATPYRMDRQDVIDLCGGNVVADYGLLAGVQRGLLVPYDYYGLFDGIDYTALSYNSQFGYRAKDLDRVLAVPERDEAIVEMWQKRGLNRPSLAFCRTKKHAHRMSKVFNDVGIPSAVYLGTTQPKKRKELIADLKSGRKKVLFTVDVLNEGADLPFVEVLLFLRPTESERVFIQQLGRGLRKSPGKKKVVVLDFIGNFVNAYRILFYLRLTGDDTEMIPSEIGRFFSAKKFLLAPTGCKVTFDEKVIALFEDQYKIARGITPKNIGDILETQYHKLYASLGRPPTRMEYDRAYIINSAIYKKMYGNWEKFTSNFKQGNSR